jgi:hypothetical protein
MDSQTHGGTLETTGRDNPLATLACRKRVTQRAAARWG